MIALTLAILFTLGVSAFCSLLEAFILSISTAEIEQLKIERPRKGELLEKFKLSIEETSSAILTLNTVANTLGSIVTGAIAAKEFDSFTVGIITAGMVIGILIFSEILPKNLGVAYRKSLLNHLVYPLYLVRVCMWPFSSIARILVNPLLPDKEIDEEEQEREIILLAEKSAKEGSLTTSERDIVANALSLDDVHVGTIMTPRTVVTFLEMDLTVAEVCRDFKIIPFARIPVYNDSIDDVVGMVRRRDIMQAFTEGNEQKTMNELKVSIDFVPETANGLAVLQIFLQKHQQMALVVDEYGSTAGVVTMEDIVEHILGKEIYEESDVAIDMRELARKNASGKQKDSDF